MEGSEQIISSEVKVIAQGFSSQTKQQLYFLNFIKKTKTSKKKKKRNVFIVRIDILSFSLEIITLLNSWKIKADSITVKTHSFKAETGASTIIVQKRK